MTEQTERLAQIKARAENATYGPWERVTDEYVQTVDRPATSTTRHESPVRIVEAWTGTDDLDFIAHAREDIPYLLDLLAEKDATIRRLAEAGVTLGGECERISEVASQQDVTIQRVRGLLDHLGPFDQRNLLVALGDEEA